jgi:protein-tyrosine sulfotransferase
VTLLDKFRNRVARARQHPWRMRAYRSDERHVVIGACPRSGTTLLRRIIDRHPSLCCGPETSVLIPNRFLLGPLSARSGISEDDLREMLRTSPSQGAFVDQFAARYRSDHGKPRWAEKTPLNVRHFGWVLERFPQVRLIHVIRDGRDVICSLAEHPDWRWVDGGWVKELHPRPLEAHARTWVRFTGAGLRFRADPRYHEVRYEDLVERPEQTLRTLMSFIGEPFHERLLEPDRDRDAVGSPDRGEVSGASVGRWRRDLSSAALAKVLPIMGPRLAELGYEV